MKITGTNAMSPLATQNKAVAYTGGTAKTDKGASFDQITLNTQREAQGEGRIQQEVASKLSHEIRTHNTTSKIAQLKEEVQSGTYQMDARETAARMLLMGDVE